MTRFGGSICWILTALAKLHTGGIGFTDLGWIFVTRRELWGGGRVGQGTEVFDFDGTF